jgi:hypothetical protein
MCLSEDAAEHEQHAVDLSSHWLSTAAVMMEMHRGRPDDPGL